jgi:orotidine-5'-phosphate decarboxylase
LTREDLFSSIQKKHSYLCIGLDADIKKIPQHLLKLQDPVFEFNKRIIDATHSYCIAYKPNIAFYESLGVKGWESLQKTIDYIPKDIFTIADAKRGDIGNTSDLYARTFFDPASSGMEFDAVTVAPYMGKDSVTPFLKYPNKWSIILAHTSNEGSKDFQVLTVGDKKLYQIVIEKTQQWGSKDQIMYVVGATHPEAFREIREFAPDHFLLVPGVGAQGGDLEKISANGFNTQCGLIVNSSRGIIYASTGDDFDLRAKQESLSIQQEMKMYLDKYL